MADAINGAKIISRKDAIANGLRHYFTGKPCKRGHIAQRRITSMRCVVCARDALNEARRADPEHARNLDRKYKSANRQKLRERDRARYWSNPAKPRAKSRKAYWSDPETAKAKARKHRRESRLRGDDRYLAWAEKNRARVKNWQEKNLDRYRAHLRNLRAKRKGAIGKHTASDVRDIYRMQKGRCAFCKIKLGTKYHVDHITALAAGGTNFRNNLQLLCAPCNLHKGPFDQMDIMRSKGMLL